MGRLDPSSQHRTKNGRSSSNKQTTTGGCTFRSVVTRLFLGLAGLVSLRNLMVVRPTELVSLYSTTSGEAADAAFVNPKSNPDRTKPHHHDYDLHAPPPPIRSWGCHRTETPTIFVHIGKAGGGEVRKALALAAANVTRELWREYPADEHYYPIPQDASKNPHRRAKFCNSRYPHLFAPRPGASAEDNWEDHYEGFRYCDAATPLGVALGCPMAYQNWATKGSHHTKFEASPYDPKHCGGCDDEYYLEVGWYLHTPGVTDRERLKALNKLVDPPPARHSCELVYTGHNYFGTEVAWLPPRYLKEHWWDTAMADHHHNANAAAEGLWKALLRDRETRSKGVLKALENVQPPQSRIADTATYQAALEDPRFFCYDQCNETTTNDDNRWCPQGYRYHLQKSGLKSKTLEFDRPSRTINGLGARAKQWNEATQNFYEACTVPMTQRADVALDPEAFAVPDRNYAAAYAALPVHRVTQIRDPWSWLVSKYFWHRMGDNCFVTTKPAANAHEVLPPHNGTTLGWLDRTCLVYLFYLCGPDCKNRWQRGLMGIRGIERQAADNLRTGFSVVGLLGDSEEFFDMLHTRIAYLDLNKTLDLTGQRHATKHEPHQEECKKAFTTNEDYRQQLRDLHPNLAALERVYRVGLEVHAFQKDELSKCPGSAMGRTHREVAKDAPKTAKDGKEKHKAKDKQKANAKDETKAGTKDEKKAGTKKVNKDAPKGDAAAAKDETETKTDAKKPSDTTTANEKDGAKETNPDAETVLAKYEAKGAAAATEDESETSSSAPNEWKPRKRSKQTKTKTKRPPPGPPVFGDSFSACILWMDDNHRLEEWLAYHYYLLRLRYVVINVDPNSRTSPQAIVDRWNDPKLNLNMTVVTMTDTDYVHNYPREMTKIERKRTNGTLRDYGRAKTLYHRTRQGQFYRACSKHLVEHGRTWTSYHDIDEFFAFSNITNMGGGTDHSAVSLSKMRQPGYVLDRLNEIKRDFPASYEVNGTLLGCLQVSRRRFCAKELEPEEVDAMFVPSTDNATRGQVVVPGAFATNAPGDRRSIVQRFDTLRYQYLTPGRDGVHKSIHDLSLPETQEYIEDDESEWKIHDPMLSLCHENVAKLKSAPSLRKALVDEDFLIYHYLGSFESYSFRDDARQGGVKSYEMWYNRSLETQGEISRVAWPWLQGFANLVGGPTVALHLLQDAGKFPEGYNATARIQNYTETYSFLGEW